MPTIARSVDERTNRGLATGADLIAARAKRRVAVKSGKLRDAIHVEAAEAEEGKGYAVVAGDEDAFYGHMVEFGTTHSPAEPFLVPALEESRDEILKLVGWALKGL